MKAGNLPDPLDEDDGEDPATMNDLHEALERIEVAVSAAVKLLLVIAAVLSLAALRYFGFL